VYTGIVREGIDMARKPFTQTCYECGKKIPYGKQQIVNVEGYFYIYCENETTGEVKVAA